MHFIQCHIWDYFSCIIRLSLQCYDCWTNICHFSSCYPVDHADTFVNAKNISYWDLYSQEIHFLRANTFYLQDGDNTIYVHFNKLHTIEAGTFVMPAKTGTVELGITSLSLCNLWSTISNVIRSFVFTYISLTINQLCKVVNLYEFIWRYSAIFKAELKSILHQ